MFSHEGDARSSRQNRILAGYLALVAGFANSAGFLIVGTFTSHVTGNVGRAAVEVTTTGFGSTLETLGLIVGFFAGAFFCSVILESRLLGHVSRGYTAALSLEAALLTVAALGAQTREPGLQVGAAVICVAMGVQNGLVTRLSGAIVRTTHLTGVVTDLGIEMARWFRYARWWLRETTRMPTVAGRNVPPRPRAEKTWLLGTIFLAFFVGAFAGALAARSWGTASMFVPAAAVALCAVYAFVNGRHHRDDGPPSLR